MKTLNKLTILSTMIIALTIIVEKDVLAQCNSSVPNWCIGGNNATANHKFGTMNNFPINIFTNGTKKMIFTTGSSLGTGSSKGDGISILSPNNTGNNIDLWTSTATTGLGSGETHAKFDGSGSIDGQNSHFEFTGNYNGLWFNTSQPVGFHSFNIQSTEKMRIAANGNVGIGTTTPVSKLDVEGGVSIGATYSGTTVAPTNGAIIEGNVGIGTFNPNRVGNAGRALTIASDIDGTTSSSSLELWLNTNNITSNSPIIGALRFFAGTSANQNAIIASRISGTNVATGILSFYTRPAGSGVTERMRIDENGNVGIGTQIPIC